MSALTQDETTQRFFALAEDFAELRRLSQAHNEILDQRMSRIHHTLGELSEAVIGRSTASTMVT